MSQPQRSIRLTGRSAVQLGKTGGNDGEIFYDNTNQTLWVYGKTTKTPLATESYVDDAIDNIPATDLSGLATETYVTTAIGNIPATDLSGLATELYVTTAISNLVDTAPTTLNTLNELAAALGDDANFATTVTTALGTKAPTDSPTFTGTTTLQQSTELLDTKTSATGTVTHDFLDAAIWYHSSISANFTANFTNIPTTNNRTIVCTLILNQGATAYIPNAVQIDGVSQTISWLGGSAPTGTSSSVDIVSFTLVRSDNAWNAVLGSLSSYG